MSFCGKNKRKPTIKWVSVLMVPPLRIELRAEHYHCSVLPLNYGGICYIIIPKFLENATTCFD